MANSLHDQLLKVGLVDKNKLKKARQDQRKKDKQERRSKTKAVDQKQQQAEQALASKVERDRKLNRQRQEKAESKAIFAQIRQLIETNRQPQDDGEIPYNFIDDKKIKKIYVSEETRKQLSSGRLAITKLDSQYEIVPAAIAEKIRIRDEKCVIPLNTSQENNAGDDTYADYRVPDDLVW
jgi:uncharacterized protein YaiL (DUF2058 family)